MAGLAPAIFRSAVKDPRVNLGDDGGVGVSTQSWVIDLRAAASAILASLCRQRSNRCALAAALCVMMSFIGYNERRLQRERARRVKGDQLDNPTPKLGSLLREGRALLDEHDPIDAHDNFGHWVDTVAHWLETDLASPSLSAAWSGLPYSALVSGGGYYDEPRAWAHFQSVVSRRLMWLGEALSLHQAVRGRARGVGKIGDDASSLTATAKPEPEPTSPKPSGEIFTLKPTLYGVGVDFKELARRFHAWRAGRRGASS
jgi:hypothetical protein